MGELSAGWPIGVAGVVAGVVVGVLAAVSKDWLGAKARLPLDFAYARLAGSALLRRTALAKYTRALYDRHRRFAVSFQVDEDLKLPMESVYVPLRGARADGVPGELAADLRAERHSVVLGVPGAGKTMLLRHQVLMWARQRVRTARTQDEKASGDPADGRQTRERKPGRRHRVDLGELRDIPVLLELRQLNKAPELTLEQHIVQHFARHHFPGADKWVARALERGDLALYFDGLDEVSTKLRPQVADRIEEFAARYASCRVVVTCRIAVYEGWFADSFGQTLRVRDFDEHLIRRFLNGWPWRTGTAVETASTVDQVLRALRDTPQIMALARNPLLLTMIAYLYDFVYADTDQVLPHTRAEFYKQVIDSLLIDRHRRQSKFPFPLKKAVLQELALVAQDIPSGVHDRLALPHGKVLETIRRVLEQQQREPAVAEAVLNEIVHRSGLLLAVDNGERYQFAHLTLQEYLAAVTLAADPAGLLRRYREDPAAWRETVRLWCGVEPRDCTEVVRMVFAQDALLAFQCLADAHTIEDGLAEEILGHFREMLGAASQSFGSVSVTDEAVITAFGLVASDQRRRGAAVFDFLVETIRSDPDPDRARAAAYALASTNLPKAVGILASMARPDTPAWSALVTMGDLAVSAFQEQAARHVEAVHALRTIRTPKAALVLNHLLWHPPNGETRLHCAFHLGELISVPEIAEELSTAPVGRNIYQDLNWVWRPFARGADDSLVPIAAAIAAITDSGGGDAWATLPAPDPRIVAALVVIKQVGALSAVRELRSTVWVQSELADWLRRRSGAVPLHLAHASVSESGEISRRGLARYLEEEVDTSNSFVLQQVNAVLAAAGLTENRLRFLARLPDWLQMRAAAALLKQQEFAGPESWDAAPPESEAQGCDYDTSPHYRFVLLMCLALSGVAVVGAVMAAGGDQPWGPRWLAIAVPGQIVVGWVILFWNHRDNTALVVLGLLPAVVLSILIREHDRDPFTGLGTAGLLPAVGVYSYVAMSQAWSVLAAIAVLVTAVGACCAAAARGITLQRRWNARTHPICDLVLKPLL